jgi:hypothetical protein
LRVQNAGAASLELLRLLRLLLRLLRWLLAWLPRRLLLRLRLLLPSTGSSNPPPFCQGISKDMRRARWSA